MKRVWMKFGGVAGALVLALLSASAQAADQSGLTTAAATELGKRSKPEAENGTGLSENAVRIMMTYAFSLVKGPDGKSIDLDQADKAVIEKYSIDTLSASRVIRAATRSAYADVCNLPELGAANYRTMVAKEQLAVKEQGLAAGQGERKLSPEQLQMIDALYLFAVSYFTGNAKITNTGSEDPSAAQAGGAEEAKLPPPPKCPPEQRQKVESSIKAYVAEAGGN